MVMVVLGGDGGTLIKVSYQLDREGTLGASSTKLYSIFPTLV